MSAKGPRATASVRAVVAKGAATATPTVVPVKRGRPYARWSKAIAAVGDEVEMTAEFDFPPAGAEFTIYEYDDGGSNDDLVEKVAPVVQGNTATAKWKVKYVDDSDDPKAAEEIAKKGYTLPEFYFKVQEGGKEACHSGMAEPLLLKVTDVIDREILDDVAGIPMPGAMYEIELADGTKREGKLDDKSRVHEENVPPGKFWIRLKTGKARLFDFDGAFSDKALEPSDRHAPPIPGATTSVVELAEERKPQVIGVAASPALVA